MFPCLFADLVSGDTIAACPPYTFLSSFSFPVSSARSGPLSWKGTPPPPPFSFSFLPSNCPVGALRSGQGDYRSAPRHLVKGDTLSQRAPFSFFSFSHSTLPLLGHLASARETPSRRSLALLNKRSTIAALLLRSGCRESLSPSSR